MAISSLRAFALIALLSLCISKAQAQLLPTPPAAGEMAFAAGNWESAQKSYSAAVKAAPEALAPRLGLIRTLMRQDNWPEALTEAQATTLKFPACADAHGLLSLALIRAGWSGEYVKEAAQSLALDANNFWGLLATGRAAEWEGDYKAAHCCFWRASETHPEWPEGWGQLLVLEDDTLTPKEALQIAAIYLKLDPHGHPHREIVENARDVTENVAAYQTVFSENKNFERILSPGAAGTNTPQSSTMAVDFLGDFAIFPVTINGQPFRLLFDTGGGSDILLYWNSAKRLHLRTLAHTHIRGVGGGEKSDVLKAESMEIAGIPFRSIKIVTAETMVEKTDGILGGNILNDSVVTLDFEKKTALLMNGANAQAPAPLSGDKSITLPFHYYHGCLYIQAAVNGQPLWALLDTGAFRSTLSLRLAREQLKGLPKEDIQTGTFTGKRGIGNSDASMQYIVSRYESQIQLSQNPPVYIPIDTAGTSDLDRQISPSAQTDFEISLWMGMSSFTYARRITFDYPRHQLIFEYKDPDLISPARPAKK